MDGSRFFNVFDAAPENDRNPQQAQLKVRVNTINMCVAIPLNCFFLCSKRIRSSISFRLGLHKSYQYCTGVDKGISIYANAHVAQGCGEISSERGNRGSA